MHSSGSLSKTEGDIPDRTIISERAKLPCHSRLQSLRVAPMITLAVWFVARLEIVGCFVGRPRSRSARRGSWREGSDEGTSLIPGNSRY